ncbi:uridine kinase [Candidatus Woesearchaeota archaeon]|nr:uridine kinase [Candidatus Woesearchaeota archaeon]
MDKTFSFAEGIEALTTRISSLRDTTPVVIVGVAGGSASGKGYLTRQVESRINGLVPLAIDHYYLGKKDMPDPTNYDRPDSLELSLLVEHLAQLRQGRSVQRPQYDFASSCRIGTEELRPGQVIWVDGLFALHDTVRDALDIRIFVDSSEEERLARRKYRDIAEGRRPVGPEGQGTVEDTITRYWNAIVEPMYREHIAPTKRHAHIVITNTGLPV